jgi:hypothetical protein
MAAVCASAPCVRVSGKASTPVRAQRAQRLVVRAQAGKQTAQVRREPFGSPRGGDGGQGLI